MRLLSSRITDELAAQLRGATSARGYTSNVGATVQVGLLRGAASEAPACYVIPGRQAAGTTHYAGRRTVQRSYEVRGFIDLNTHTTLSEYEAVDLVIWDLRRCLESAYGALDELTERVAYVGDRPGYREEGGTIVGAAVDYLITYHVDILHPDLAL